MESMPTVVLLKRLGRKVGVSVVVLETFKAREPDFAFRCPSSRPRVANLTLTHRGRSDGVNLLVSGYQLRLLPREQPTENKAS